MVRKFYYALPFLRKWIENTLSTHEKCSRPVIDYGFIKLNKIFGEDLLTETKVVIFDGDLPFPPLSNIGITELSEFENMSAAGITFKNMYFLNSHHQSEDIHFHELVHVIQWNRLGVDKFLLAYGTGIIQYGYLESPLEKMAYSLEKQFSQGNLEGDIIGFINRETDKIWEYVSDSFTAFGL